MTNALGGDSFDALLTAFDRDDGAGLGAPSLRQLVRYFRARLAEREAALARVWSELHDFEVEPGVAAWEALDGDTIARVLAIVEPPPEGT